MSAVRYLHTIPQIVQMLNARAFELARQIFPAGRRAGSEWTVKNLQGDPGTELSVCIGGAKQGLWKQFNADGRASGGDMLELITQARCGGDKSEGIRWAKAWLGLDGADPEALKRTHQAVELQKREKPEEQATQFRAAAYRILQGSRADVRGTLADEYLQGRGLHIRELLFPIENLRFNAKLRANRKGEPDLHYPAMVAPIFNFGGKFRAVHRTWLHRGADGRVVKAPIAEPKRTLGTYGGGFIPLWRGTVTDDSTGEIRMAPHLRAVKAPVWVDLTEGIEDGLTVALACPEARVYVGVALASMAMIRWPAQLVAGVNIWQQNDPELDRHGKEHPARRTLRNVVQNYQRQGIAVRLVRPPEEWGKDPNEALQRLQSDSQPDKQHGVA